MNSYQLPASSFQLLEPQYGGRLSAVEQSREPALGRWEWKLEA
jgi:hypothetical protein